MTYRYLHDSYFPVYNKETNYNSNSKSYYDYLARVNEFLKVISDRVDEYDKVLADKLKEINNELEYYMTEWDKRIEKFPESVELMMVDWMEDGTLDDIINENIFNDLNTKIETVDTDLNQSINNVEADLTQEMRQIGTTTFIRN